jgi:hypothetical protein
MQMQQRLPPGRARLRRFMVAAACIVAVAVIVIAGSLILVAVSAARIASIERDLTSLPDAGLGFSESMHRADDALGAMERQLRVMEIAARPLRWAGPLVKVVPYYGGTLSQASDIAKYGRALASAAQRVAAAAGSISVESDQRRKLELAQAALSHADGAVAQAERQVQGAAEARTRIESSRLTPGASALLEDADRVYHALVAFLSARTLMTSAVRVALTLDEAMDPGLAGHNDQAQRLAPALEDLAKSLDGLSGRADDISRGMVAAGVLAGQDLPPEVGDAEWSRRVLAASGELVRHAADLLRALDHGLPIEESSALPLEDALTRVGTDGRALLALVPNLTPEHRGRPIADEVERLLVLAEAAADHALDVLGFRGERTHLVLGQDENELRPGGGFIGVVVEMTLRRGIITNTRFMDSYDVDRDLPIALWRPAPQSFLTATGSPVMPFRDLNWDADFSQSANSLRTAYLTATNNLPHLIVAVDRPAIARIVDALGGARISSTGELLSGARVRSILLATGAPAETSGGGWRTESRKVAAEVSEAILSRLAVGVRLDLPAVLRALMDSAAAGDIVVSATDDQGKSLYGMLGVDGSVPQLTGLAFHWVESNVYADKISRSVDRVIEQQVQPREDGSAEVRLTARYSNRARGQGPCVQPSLAPNPPCYWTLVRLYLPESSENVRPGVLPTLSGALAASRLGRAPDPVALANVAVAPGHRAVEASAFFRVPPGGTVEWTVEYDLPPGAMVAANGRPWEPSLQPGMAPVRIELQALPLERLCGTSQATVLETTYARAPDAPLQVFSETIHGCPSREPSPK